MIFCGHNSGSHLVYDGTQSVKHLIESLGVPHTEVEVILANGRSVDFNYLVQADDQISIYPPFHTVDVSPLVPLRPSLTPPYHFILDNHLGKLARTLRLLGLDTLYASNEACRPGPHRPRGTAHFAHAGSRPAEAEQCGSRLLFAYARFAETVNGRAPSLSTPRRNYSLDALPALQRLAAAS